ncbi:MAG: hypothetical protein ACEY3H_07340, partial [Wolbachia sp.]
SHLYILLMSHYTYAWPGTNLETHLFGKAPGDWTLPGYNCMAPGNAVVNLFPVDRDDLIALRHDQDYHLAETEKDVRKADREAI